MARKNFKSLAQIIFISVLNGADRSHLINLETKFKEYFERDVETDDELNYVKRFIFEECNLIKQQLFPLPFYESINNEKILVTWFHPAYFTYSNVLAPNDSFFELFNWIHQCDANDFLLACTAYFAAINSKKIFITDRPNDGGIDLVAINHLLDQIPTLFLVQAKSTLESKISREVLLQEVGKFHNLPQKDTYSQYIQHIDRNLNGCNYAHVFITNSRINLDAIKEAFFAKSILINDLRLASAISRRFTLEQILDVGKRMKMERNSKKYEYDLQYNIALKFDEIV